MLSLLLCDVVPELLFSQEGRNDDTRCIVVIGVGKRLPLCRCRRGQPERHDREICVRASRDAGGRVVHEYASACLSSGSESWYKAASGRCESTDGIR